MHCVLFTLQSVGCCCQNRTTGARRSPETRPEGRKKNTEDLPAHERPPARTGFSVFHLELELDCLSDYTGREWTLYPRAPTCRAAPERSHLPLATSRAHRLAHSDRACTRSPRPRTHPTRSTPPDPSLATQRTHALTHAHTHAYTWARTHAPNGALVRVRRVQRTRSRAPHSRLATGYSQQGLLID